MYIRGLANIARVGKDKVTTHDVGIGQLPDMFMTDEIEALRIVDFDAMQVLTADNWNAFG